MRSTRDGESIGKLLQIGSKEPLSFFSHPCPGLCGLGLQKIAGLPSYNKQGGGLPSVYEAPGCPCKGEAWTGQLLT